MTDTPSPRTATPDTAGAFDRVAGTVALAVALVFVAMALSFGPCEAMERLAVLLRKVLPFWGR